METKEFFQEIFSFSDYVCFSMRRRFYHLFLILIIEISWKQKLTLELKKKFVIPIAIPKYFLLHSPE